MIKYNLKSVKLRVEKLLNSPFIITLVFVFLMILNCRTTGLAIDNSNENQENTDLNIFNQSGIESEKYYMSPFLLPVNGLYKAISYDISHEHLIYNFMKDSLEMQEEYIEESNQNTEDNQKNLTEDSSVEIEGKSNEAVLISKLDTADKKIALTFDDCNNRTNMIEILKILSENKVKATFFVTGDTIQYYPDMLVEIVESGNTIGNHSYTHSDFTKLTLDEIKEEVEKTEELIKEITGKSTKPIFRPPYGSFNENVIETVGSLGYTDFVYWSIDTRDWSGISADKITDEVLTKAKPGSIVLMHASYGAKNTAEALPDIIKGLKDMGYEFVVLGE